MRYDLKAETSRQGHRWASRGWMRGVLNFIDQTPRQPFGAIALLAAGRSHHPIGGLLGQAPATDLAGEPEGEERCTRRSGRRCCG